MAVPPGTFPPGTLIANRYKVVRWLGKGAFGEVYAVEDQHQGQLVALKLIGSTGGGTWAEAQVLTYLRSPYILPVWNADYFAGVPFLVTDLAENGTVGDRIAPRGVPMPLAIRWTIAVCRGAQRTHDANLLHRDIKPDNIFLTADDEALLGDFGLACLMNPPGEGPYGGTVTTMAPEVAAGGNTSRESDVYSIGATFYALLAGRFPHHAPTGPAVRALVIAGPPPSVRDYAHQVPIALARRVEKAIARDRADRYPTPAAFAADLGRVSLPARLWWRTDEHQASGHLLCWRGEAKGKTDATVCVVPAGSRFAVEAAHQPTGRRITAACKLAGPESALPTKLRTAIAAVS
jgi:serine/threonine protein kinase